MLNNYETIEFIGHVNYTDNCSICKDLLIKHSVNFYVYEAKRHGVLRPDTLIICKACYKAMPELQKIRQEVI
jgi:hypothetical protein